MNGSCDQQCPVKLPIEHLKLAAGEIEIKFSTEIDVSTETGQLAHELHKAVLMNAIKYVKSCLSKKKKKANEGLNVSIEVGNNSFLGQGSGENRPSEFQYYATEQMWVIKFQYTDDAYQIISDDSSYQWKYDSSGSHVVMEMYNGSFETNNLFKINFNNGFITPNGSITESFQVFGFAQSPCSHLPVGISGDHDLKVNTVS